MTLEELTDYIFELIKEEVKGGLRIYPNKFRYTRFVLKLSDEFESNPLKIINEGYEGIVKEFVSYIK